MNASEVGPMHKNSIKQEIHRFQQFFAITRLHSWSLASVNFWPSPEPTKVLRIALETKADNE